MRKPIQLTLYSAIVFTIYYVLWPMMLEDTATVKSYLNTMKLFSETHLLMGYALYITLLSIVLFVGLPIASVMILLAGVIYGFWNAFALVLFCRLGIAVLSFFAAKQWAHMQHAQAKKPMLMKKFEHHPNLGLLLARLSPLPDMVVNYTVATSSIKNRDYIIYSTLGMVPFTFLYTWLGYNLGSISQLIRWIQ